MTAQDILLLIAFLIFWVVILPFIVFVYPAIHNKKYDGDVVINAPEFIKFLTKVSFLEDYYPDIMHDGDRNYLNNKIIRFSKACYEDNKYYDYICKVNIDGETTMSIYANDSIFVFLYSKNKNGDPVMVGTYSMRSLDDCHVVYACFDYLDKFRCIEKSIGNIYKTYSKIVV